MILLLFIINLESQRLAKRISYISTTGTINGIWNFTIIKRLKMYLTPLFWLVFVDCFNQSLSIRFKYIDELEYLL